ncbi:MAG: hypothetical protein RR898_09540 [Clostridium sp.]|uniref:hypothetical protein n=1 Tax=Clostridium sp. TaxID=1506 RepID=UPI002FC65FCD
MRIYVVSYIDEGKTVERGFRDISEANKLKKIKRGSIRQLEVELKPVIKFDKYS